MPDSTPMATSDMQPSVAPSQVGTSIADSSDFGSQGQHFMCDSSRLIRGRGKDVCLVILLKWKLLMKEME